MPSKRQRCNLRKYPFLLVAVSGFALKIYFIIIERNISKNTIFETELKQLGSRNNVLTNGWICEEIEKAAKFDKSGLADR